MSADELRKTAEVLHDTWGHGIVSLTRPDPQQYVISVGPFVDELMRGRADRHKPLYRELRDEGLTQPAIELLHEGRDMLELRYSPYEFAKWLNEATRAGIREADLYPDGRTEREPLPLPPPDDISGRIAWDWLELEASHAAEWGALEASWVAEWSAADSPAAHQVCADLWWENQL